MAGAKGELRTRARSPIGYSGYSLKMTVRWCEVRRWRRPCDGRPDSRPGSGVQTTAGTRSACGPCVAAGRAPRAGPDHAWPRLARFAGHQASCGVLSKQPPRSRAWGWRSVLCECTLLGGQTHAGNVRCWRPNFGVGSTVLMFLRRTLALAVYDARVLVRVRERVSAGSWKAAARKQGKFKGERRDERRGEEPRLSFDEKCESVVGALRNFARSRVPLLRFPPRPMPRRPTPTPRKAPPAAWEEFHMGRTGQAI